MSNQRGFTLLELVLGLVAGAVIAAVAFMLLTPVHNWFFTKQRVIGLDDTRAALTRMTNEIKRIKSSDDISTFAAQQLTFTDYDDNVVTFQQSGTDLLKNGAVLARNVQNFNFTYLKDDGTVALTAQEIRVIRVRLDIASGNEIIRLRSGERIRNIP